MPLVVVDVQPHFKHSGEEAFLACVEKEIVRAVNDGLPVIIVEYVGFGDTYERLTKHLEGYTRVRRVSKNRRDGSVEILEACREAGFGTAFFRVCGLYTFECVAETVEGLAQRSPGCRIHVVEEALMSPVIGWGMFPVVANASLVSQNPGKAINTLGADRTGGMWGP